VEGRDGGVPCGEPMGESMGEEGGLLAAGETSYHKWRRGRLLQVVCVLAPGEGSNAYGHARAMRTPLMKTRNSPDRRRLRDLYLHAWVRSLKHGRGVKIEIFETQPQDLAPPTYLPHMRTERINMLAVPPAHVGDRKIVHSWRDTEPGRTRPPAGRLRERLRLPRRIGRATEGGGGEGGGGAGGGGEGGGGEGGGGEGGGEGGGDGGVGEGGGEGGGGEGGGDGGGDEGGGDGGGGEGGGGEGGGGGAGDGRKGGGGDGSGGLGLGGGGGWDDG
jgi:hypothetical protein